MEPALLDIRGQVGRDPFGELLGNDAEGKGDDVRRLPVVGVVGTPIDPRLAIEEGAIDAIGKLCGGLAVIVRPADQIAELRRGEQRATEVRRGGQPPVLRAGPSLYPGGSQSPSTLIDNPSSTRSSSQFR